MIKDSHDKRRLRPLVFDTTITAEFDEPHYVCFAKTLAGFAFNALLARESSPTCYKSDPCFAC